MEIIKIENLTYSYNNAKYPSLTDINLSINEGELVLICGHSGCGKTTLLKQMKYLLKNQGSYTGSIHFKDENIQTLPSRTLVSKLGYVFQNPDNQIVCDTPLSEMAFGLENLGVAPDEIRRRVAEMASYFGIVKHLHQDVNTLSGGQKQTLNLASVMAMHPDVLLLDEPTSMLDPVARSEFFAIVNKLNKELGLTIIIVEHNLESLYSMADKVCYMEEGKIVKYDTAKNVAEFLVNEDKKMLNALPSSVLMKYKLDKKSAQTPLTVKDGRYFLIDYISKTPDYIAKAYEKRYISKEPAITAKNVYFRYSKNDKDILKGVNLTVHKGEFLAIHGDNGSGKTTLLKVLSGIHKPYSGKIKSEKCAYLPQNQLLTFVKDEIYEDIIYTADANNISQERIEALINSSPFFTDIPKFYGRNPLDISCGEQQRLALFKIMLTNPEIILLDEPTKSLDSFSKEYLAKLLLEIKTKGTTLVMVSHDLDFSAKYADSCSMFFDGTIISNTDPISFFTTNHFYTTTTAKLTKDILPEVVNLEQL